MNDDRATLARMMPDALPIFFDGRRPYESQRLVMPAIVRGQNILFAAPTASGKTEAAIAPLFQRHRSFARGRLSTVYVAPTKALVNDLYERLVGYLGTRFPEAIARYTGDRHEFRSPEGAFCLLATPEALDSLQLRRPAALSYVRALVIDEIHLLHGQPRGQQLRHVIDRLRVAAQPSRSLRDAFQLVGMTATLDDMQGVARLWLGNNPEVISSGTAREIDLDLLACAENDDPSPEQARVLADWINRTRAEKVLVFANSRNGAHALAAHLHRELEGSRWPVHLHFGSLAASQREIVEQRMRTERYGICVATSTLEIGIDIGDIDAVVLADPPPTVSAFLQRIGRGNRRTGKCRVVAFRRDESDERIYRALVDCGARGEIDDTFEYQRPSVEFQQALSLCWRATRQEKALNIRNLAKEAGCDLAAVVGDMLDTGCMQDVRGALIPCDRLLDEADAGKIHSVIAGQAGPSVLDFRTGDVALKDADGSAGGALFLGGQMRKLKIGEDGKSYLGDVATDPRRLAKIQGSGGKIVTGRAVIRGLARQLGENPDRWRTEGPEKLLTWGGETYNRLLSAVFSRETGEEFEAFPFGVTGPMSSISLSMDWIRSIAARAEAANDLPVRVASKFTNSSKFISELSDRLRADEQRRSVPWAPFRCWLKAVEGIDGV
jgi:ATP-dependent Lhr-like helicase